MSQSSEATASCVEPRRSRPAQNAGTIERIETRDAEGTSAVPMLEHLDYIYMPSPDVASDAAYFTDVLGGRLVFAIDEMATRVAMIQLTDDPPRIVLAGHLAGDRPILIYRVDDLRTATTELEARGWKRGHSLEIPQGPVCSFDAPGGQRLAIYQLTRPGVEASFEGRRDF